MQKGYSLRSLFILIFLLENFCNYVSYVNTWNKIYMHYSSIDLSMYFFTDHFEIKILVKIYREGAKNVCTF